MIIGMDVSSYPEMKDKGYRYYDENGTEIDVLEYELDARHDHAYPNQTGCGCGMRRKIYRNLADIVICCKRLQWQNG